MRTTHHRIAYTTYNRVPTWAHITFCRRSRAATIIQSEYLKHLRRRKRRAAATIRRFFARHVDGWQTV